MNNTIYFDNYIIDNSFINTDNITFVKNKTTNQICIQKIIPTLQKEVYEYLSQHHINNTPEVYDIKYFDNFIVVLTEYIEGSTLTEYLNNIYLQTKDDVKYDINTFYILINNLLDIVKNLQHSNRIIHKDIKPDNIIITKNNELYLIDFDSAKIYTNTNKKTQLLVSIGYAAPEQYGFGNTNMQTDIYAIGKIIDDFTTIIDNDDLSKKLQPIINKCCELNYKDRYKNISHLKADIYRAKHNLIFLAIPGFRTGNVINEIIATFCYFSLFYICFINTHIKNYILNLIIFLSIILSIFIIFNYLDIHKYIPFGKSKNKFFKWFSIILFAILIPTIIILCFIFFYK